MDHIAELKKVKVPLWAVLLGRWRKWKRRHFASRQWRLVATITAWASSPNDGEKCPAWYMLYERGDGKRCYRFNASLRYGLKPHQTTIFNRVVQPWVDHIHDNNYARKVAELTFNAP